MYCQCYTHLPRPSIARPVSQKRWIAICLVIFATIRCGFGFENCSIALMYPVWKIFREKVYQTMVVGWALSAVVDSSIAFMLYLYLRKRRTGTNRNDNILNQLLLYSVNTGAVTSFCAVLVIILFLCIPSSLAFIRFVQIQSKFYAISLLASCAYRSSSNILCALAENVLHQVKQPRKTQNDRTG